jgi:hypothetical protein
MKQFTLLLLCASLFACGIGGSQKNKTALSEKAPLKIIVQNDSSLEKYADLN